MSVLLALSNYDAKSKLDHSIYLIKELLLESDYLNLSVQFVWIPGHKGIDSNELADKLAKQALSLSVIFRKKIYPCNLFYFF